MKIRNKLTYLFIGLVAFLIFILSVSIYFFSDNFREEEFYRRLMTRATSTAKLLVDVDEVDATLLQIIEKSTPQSLPEEKIIIIDYQNEEIFSTDENNEIKLTAEIINQIRLKEEVKYRQGDYEILGILFTGKYDRFVVISAAIDQFGFRKLKNLRLILLIGFVASIMLVSVAGWIFSGGAVTPISRVVKQVENITESSLNLRLDEGNGKDEMALLSKTFNDMLDRLEISFKMQKNFIANASHELRTPLTAITGQLEVVLMKKRKKEEYKETLESVLDDISNLNRISNRLLLLAQTSSDKPDMLFQPFRVDDVIWQARSELMKRNKDYNIHIDFQTSAEDENALIIKGNEQLIKTAIINLMDNGCKYSNPHLVSLNLFSMENKWLAIEFSDKGIGIASEDLSHIFEPFYRSKSAINFKGHGIGLSLVDRIVKIHDGSIEVISEQGKGSDFIVRFPLI